MSVPLVLATAVLQGCGTTVTMHSHWDTRKPQFSGLAGAMCS